MSISTMTITVLCLSLILTSVLVCSATGLSTAKAVKIDMATKETVGTDQNPNSRYHSITDKDVLADQRAWAPEVTVHILSVLQQVHNKLTRWEEKMNSFEGQLLALSKAIEMQEGRLNERLNSIEGGEKELRSEILAVEQRQGNLVSAEVNNLENRLKLFWMQQREANDDGRAMYKKQVASLACVDNTTIENELLTFSDKIILNISEGLTRLGGTIDCGGLDSEKDPNKGIASIVRGDEKLEQLAINMEKQIANYTTMFYNQVTRDLNGVEAEFRESLLFQSDTLKKIATTLAGLQDTNSSPTDTPSPHVCKKGLMPIPNGIIYPSETSVITVPYVCDTQTDGGGWVVFHRRMVGDLDFYKPWTEFRNGFGNLNEDFWLGLEAIHNYTYSGKCELRVELKYGDVSAYAHYASFRVASEESKYILNLGKYSGTAGDSLSRYNWQRFSTYDRDNDRHSVNCASDDAYNGAWWWDGCGSLANLHGLWNKSGTWSSNHWHTFSRVNSVSFSEMKMRIVDSY